MNFPKGNVQCQQFIRLLCFCCFIVGSLSINPDERSSGSNKFVSAAPLVVAAVCQDGVSLVAMHILEHNPGSGEDSHGRETVLASKGTDDVSQPEATPSAETAAYTPPAFPSLPNAFRGPFRIHSIDEFGTTLACTGWRTDTSALASHCRSLAASELNRFGTPPSLEQYVRFLSEEAALWMAQCEASDNVRSLSCVGLLCGQRSLLLVDATGAYHVRAHAVGAGSHQVNEALVKTDFSGLTKEEGINTILKIVQRQQSSSKALSSASTHAEMAVVDGSSFMKRLPFSVLSQKAT